MSKKSVRWAIPALLAMVIGFSAVNANAVSIITRAAGGSGIWSQTNIWSASIVPNAGDNVFIRNGCIVTLDSTAAAINNITIGEGTTSSGMLRVVTGGYLNLTGSVAVAKTAVASGYGTLEIAGGTFIKNGSVVVGNGGITGLVSISSGTFVGSIELGSAATNLDVGDRFRVIGSTANISGVNFTAGRGSITEFIFDATGIATLNYSGIARFATGSQIIIDGAAYTGGAHTFSLLNVGDIGTSIGAPTVILTNFAAGTTYNYDTSGNTFTVTTIPEPATIGMLGFGAGAILLFRRRMMK